MTQQAGAGPNPDVVPQSRFRHLIGGDAALVLGDDGPAGGNPVLNLLAAYRPGLQRAFTLFASASVEGSPAGRGSLRAQPG